MKVEVNKRGKIEVFADKKDVCFECENQANCPLIESLRAEIVIIRYAEVDINSCGLLKKRLNDVKN